jgi:hypothetical protein
MEEASGDPGHVHRTVNVRPQPWQPPTRRDLAIGVRPRWGVPRPHGHTGMQKSAPNRCLVLSRRLRGDFCMSVWRRAAATLSAARTCAVSRGRTRRLRPRSPAAAARAAGHLDGAGVTLAG